MTYDQKDRTETLALPKEMGAKTPEDRVRELLSEDCVCYVLITCRKPSEEGKMQVEMTYEGDPVLAAYLVESAQGFL